MNFIFNCILIWYLIGLFSSLIWVYLIIKRITILDIILCLFFALFGVLTVSLVLQDLCEKYKIDEKLTKFFNIVIIDRR